MAISNPEFTQIFIVRFHHEFHLIVFVVNPFQCSMLSLVLEEGFLQSSITSCVTPLPLFCKKTCHGVATKPSLEPITSGNFNAAIVDTECTWLDIVANGFWGGAFERACFDVRVFNPFTPSNSHSSLPSSYRHHESLKRRLYECVREVEHSSFTPLVFSLTGGLGPNATAFYKCLSSQISDKWKQPYSTTSGWLRCRISFSLLRSSIVCLRGARSFPPLTAILRPLLTLTISDSNLWLWTNLLIVVHLSWTYLYWLLFTLYFSTPYMFPLLYIYFVLWYKKKKKKKNTA